MPTPHGDLLQGVEVWNGGLSSIQDLLGRRDEAVDVHGLAEPVVRVESVKSPKCAETLSKRISMARVSDQLVPRLGGSFQVE